MKNKKMITNTMGGRRKWMAKWIKRRNYIFNTNAERNDFLFYYFQTVKSCYDETWAVYLTKKMNSYFVLPLTDTELDEKIKVFNSNKYINRRYTNKFLIQKLGVTDEEVTVLRIGHNIAEKAERAKRTEERHNRNY